MLLNLNVSLNVRTGFVFTLNLAGVPDVATQEPSSRRRLLLHRSKACQRLAIFAEQMNMPQRETGVH